MPPPQTWAELPGDLLMCAAARHGHALTCYLAARGVCKAWRSVLPPPSPLLLVGYGGTVSAVSIPLRTAFSVDKNGKHYRYIGAGHGWLAVAYHKEVHVVNDRVGTQQVTRDPIAVALETMDLEPSKLRQAKEQYYRNFEGAQVRVDPDELQAIQKRRGWETSCMALLNPVTGRKIELPEHVRLDPWTVSKVAFAPNPKEDDFTAVVAFGGNSLAYISTRDGAGTWSFGGLAGGEDVIVDVAYRAGAGDNGDRVYCLTRRGDVHVLHVPRGGPTTNCYPALVPLVAGCGFNFNPSYVFPPPYDRLSQYLGGIKSLAFCDGDVYQVWRNSAATMRVLINKEGGARLRVALDEVVVLRYEPSSGQQPCCWKAVGDLGGHAVFVGPANSAVSVRAVPGVKGDCVYWMDRFGDRTAMVFDMKTRRSAPCVSPSTTDGGVPVCWYSLEDMVASCNNDAEGVLEREPKRRRLV
ncbi:hypothetical protein EJB05_39154, partial [Eragrostis curvula]